jgi:hypothetical protein
MQEKKHGFFFPTAEPNRHRFSPNHDARRQPTRYCRRNRVPALALMFTFDPFLEHHGSVPSCL